MIRPLSLILTLYGDYIRHRGGEIWVGSLIKLMENFGISEQATRSALSRMSRKRLLKVERMGKNSYYSLTEEGWDLLTKGAQRIFEGRGDRWDGEWDLVAYSIPEERREVRDRFRQELGWMGYGFLSNGAWISPHNLGGEVRELARALGIKEYVQVFRARYEGFTNPRHLVTRCWNLDRIHQRYAAFIARYSPRYGEHLRRLADGDEVSPRECFVERLLLIDEYRRFPFFDPELPEELLPEGWLGAEAAALFQHYHDLLAQKANEYFDLIFKRK